jgi:Ca2+-binding RTX toxin-like protein
MSQTSDLLKSDVPAINQTSDPLQITKLALCWVVTHSVCSGAADPDVNPYSLTTDQITNYFLSGHGFQCGGLAVYFCDVLHDVGIANAFAINVGTAGTIHTHCTVVVPYSHNYYIFDPLSGAYATNLDGSFADIGQWLDGSAGVNFVPMSRPFTNMGSPQPGGTSVGSPSGFSGIAHTYNGTDIIPQYVSGDLLGMTGSQPDFSDYLVNSRSQVYIGTHNFGGSSNDCLYGTSGPNTMYGGNGNDWIRSLGGADTLYGGAGDDWLYGGDGNDTIYGGSGNDIIRGGNGSDMLYGGDGNDWIDGGDDGSGKVGGDGSFNMLFGGNGDDSLWAGPGANALYGGPGADQFRFHIEDFKISGWDVIADFNVKEGDFITFFGVDRLNVDVFQSGGSLAPRTYITLHGGAPGSGVALDNTPMSDVLAHLSFST